MVENYFFLLTEKKNNIFSDVSESVFFRGAHAFFTFRRQ